MDKLLIGIIGDFIWTAGIGFFVAGIINSNTKGNVRTQLKIILHNKFFVSGMVGILIGVIMKQIYFSL